MANNNIERRDKFSFEGFAKSERYVNVTRNFVRRTLIPQVGMVVGDIACGTGLGTGEMKDILHGLESSIIGFDNNPASLQIAAKEVNGPNVRYIEADARYLPIPDASLDAAYMLNSLHEVPGKENKLLILKEIFRTLKPGEKVYINSTFTKESNLAGKLWGLLKLYAMENVGGKRDKTLPGFETLSTQQYQDMLTEAGFVNFPVTTVRAELTPKDMEEIAKYDTFIEGIFSDIRKPDGSEITNEEGKNALISAIRRLVEEHEARNAERAKKGEQTESPLIFPRNWIEFEAQKPAA